MNKKNFRRLMVKLNIYELIFLHRLQFPLTANVVTIQRDKVISFLTLQLKGITAKGIAALHGMTDTDLASLEELFTRLKNEQQQRAAYEESILANENFLKADLLQSPVTQPLFKRLPRKLIAEYKKIAGNDTGKVQMQKKEMLSLMLRKLNDNHIAAIHALLSMPAEQLYELLQPHREHAAMVDDNEEERRMIIENAGLCLVAAYLPSLFRITGLTRNETFISRRARETAVQLLQYIASGSKSDAEYLLQLNKILCGIKPQEPIRRLKTLGKKYIKEADDLLRSLIANWKSLRNTTIAGFRQSFLLRKGILKEGING